MRRIILALMTILICIFVNSSRIEAGEFKSAVDSFKPGTDTRIPAVLIPEQITTPAPGQTITPASGQITTPAPGQTTTPAPGQNTTPVPVQIATPTPAPQTNGPVKATEKQAAFPDENKVTICISFAGDCTLGTDAAFQYTASFPSRFVKENSDYSYFFKRVKSIFEADDLTLVNLETTLTTADKPAAKKFRFKGSPSYVNILREGSVEAVNIANNHTFDYMKKGFNDTVYALDQAGIIYSGWDKTAYYTVKGITVAMIGHTIWDDGLRDKLADELKTAREKAAIVIVSMHWGQERVYYPDERQKSLARFCIDNGADAVIGHHPHVIQGVECYKGRYIAYSLGNFCFGGNSNPKDKDCMIYQNIFEIRQGKTTGVESKIIPCSVSSVTYVNNYQPVVLYGKEKERVMQKIMKYSIRN